MSPFQPSPLLLALIVFKSFVYLEGLALLALTRSLFGRGPSRLAALLTLILAALGIFESIAPLYGAAHAPLLPTLSRVLAWQQGVPALVVASLPLALSAALPGRRFRAIDILHMILLAALLGLWLAARVV